MHNRENSKKQPAPTRKGEREAEETHTDRRIHKTKEDIREVPRKPDEDRIERTSWERPQPEKDEDRVL